MNKEYLNEIWKDIKGYEGLYQVSNFGRVKSLERIKNGRKTLNEEYSSLPVKERILKPSITNSGYLQVVLFKNNVGTTCKIHRLVAEAFLPNPNNYPCVNHKNCIKTDDTVENLEWCDYQYNNTYADRMDKIKQKLSKPVLQYDLDGNFIKEWNSPLEASITLFGKKVFSIYECCNGKRKSAGGYIWKYK